MQRCMQAIKLLVHSSEAFNLLEDLALAVARLGPTEFGSLAQSAREHIAGKEEELAAAKQRAATLEHAARTASAEQAHGVAMEDDVAFAAAAAATRADGAALRSSCSRRRQPSAPSPQPAGAAIAATQRTPQHAAAPSPSSPVATTPPAPATPPTKGQVQHKALRTGQTSNRRAPRHPLPTPFRLLENPMHVLGHAWPPEKVMQWSAGVIDGAQRWHALPKNGGQPPPPEGWEAWRERCGSAKHRVRSAAHGSHAPPPPPPASHATPPSPPYRGPSAGPYAPPPTSYAAAARRPVGDPLRPVASPPPAASSPTAGATPITGPADHSAQILSLLTTLNKRLDALEAWRFHSGRGPPATGPSAP